MHRIALMTVTASLALCACAHEPRQPASHPVSQDEITAAKVPTTDESPYGPADYSFGSTLSSDGTPSKGYPGTGQGNRPNIQQVPTTEPAPGESIAPPPVTPRTPD